MAPTNVKTVHQTSLLHTESSLDRLGLLSPTHSQRSQQPSGQITLQSVLIDWPKFLKAPLRTEMSKIEIPRSMVVKKIQVLYSQYNSIIVLSSLCTSKFRARKGLWKQEVTTVQCIETILLLHLYSTGI